jgi:hypothetical protein
MAGKAATKIDWSAAKQDYLADPTMSFQKIADKYGVVKKTVEQHAIPEKWAEARRELGVKAQELWEQKLPEMQAEARSRHLMHSKNLQAIAAKLTMYIADGNYYRDKEGNLILNPKTGKPIETPPNAAELRALSQTMKIALDLERVSLAMPTTVTGLSNSKGEDLPGLEGLAGLAKEAQEILRAKNSDTE